MKRKGFIIAGMLAFMLLTGCTKTEDVQKRTRPSEVADKAPESGKMTPQETRFGTDFGIPDDVMIRAFEEIGCSLIVGEIKGTTTVRAPHRAEATWLLYRTAVVKVIIEGDLNETEIKGKVVNLFPGASYVSALHVGKRYIMFIRRDCNWGYSWSFRDDVAEVSGKNGNTALESFCAKAKTLYQRTSIYAFRQEKIDSNAPPPELPESLIKTCLAFKANKKQRNEFARIIAESKLGSKLDKSHPVRSFLVYLPPEVCLTKGQVVRLFGAPTEKIGWSYLYSCGRAKRPARPEFPYGVLKITFDKSSRVKRLLYVQVRLEPR